ncbi:MAG: SIS domain-containing protein [Anaerolineae bacterium]|nr:SIS domain-containing protein [Anaerolineae bacterium]
MVITNNTTRTGSIRLLALDIDGVLTDGHATLSLEGEEIKRINFHDLDHLAQLQREGMPIVLITGESGPLVDAIAARFNVEYVLQSAKEKLAAVERVSTEFGIPLHEICYVGDSDRDAPALAAVGLGLAPANATPAAKSAASRVLSSLGGDGAAAEAARLVHQINTPANDYEDEIRRIAEASIAAHQRFVQESLPVVAQVAQAIARAIQGGGKIMLFGNGGSAADAQHVAGELVGRFLKESEPWPAMALTVDSSILTCVGNDWSFEDVFGRQVRALARPGDVVVGISTSGKSPNVLRGLDDGRARGCVAIGFTGAKGTVMQQHSDICFLAPADMTPRIQELHLLAWHAICEIVENTLMES